MGKLAAVTCESAKPDRRRDRLGDGDGLFLRIRPQGTKTWLIEYEFGGKRRKYTIGAYSREGAPGRQPSRMAAPWPSFPEPGPRHRRQLEGCPTRRARSRRRMGSAACARAESRGREEGRRGNSRNRTPLRPPGHRHFHGPPHGRKIGPGS
ncbi:Arm DNA-binding domain-containing protein [Methylococcus capsulatus]|uniref:Arm DNA-binding domain-containing protein n=1 Tax=Methylococcus capsulatus TaxID=414 RepID=UPI003B75CFE8